MKPTTTIILLLLLAGCMAFVAWPYVFPQKDNQKPENKAVFEKLGQISRLTITAGDGGRMAFERTGENGKITEPITAGADPFAVRDFYRQRMPQMGWERVSDQSVKGVITMRFEKKLEACTIQIRPGHFGQSIVNVEVMPFSRTPMEPPK
jgi:hypothetical protein